MQSDSQVSAIRTAAWESELESAPRLGAGQVALCLALVFASFAGLRVFDLHGLRAYLWVLPLTAAAALALGRARRWNAGELGLTLRPKPSAAYWVRASLWMSAIVLAAIAATVFLTRRGVDPFGLCPSPVRPVTALEMFLTVGLHPVLEEVLFRLVLCGALVGRVSLPVNVAISGVAFAIPHVVLGGISPGSAIGGFFLAWAFLRSGSIVTPIAMHALGNLATTPLSYSETVIRFTCNLGAP